MLPGEKFDTTVDTVHGLRVASGVIVTLDVAGAAQTATCVASDGAPAQVTETCDTCNVTSRYFRLICININI